jgi:hypothetical protein
MNTKFVFLLLSILFFQLKTIAQTNLSFDQNIGYTQHLIDNNEFEAALFNIKLMEQQTNLNPAQKDTLMYYKGWTFFVNKKLDSACTYFNTLPTTSTYYLKSRFYATFCYLYTKQNSKAAQCLNATIIDSINTDVMELKHFTAAAIALSAKNYVLYNFESKQLSRKFYATSASENNLALIAQKMQTQKNKKPWVAGILSALVPGLGKFYAGQKGGGATALLTVGGLTGVLIENVYKSNNLYAPNVIVFAGVFAVFYVGNIVGSVYATKIKKETFYNEAHNKIAMESFTPLRSIFK